MDDNIIIYDWLSFTYKTNDPYYIVSVLGLDDLPWESVKGAHGYRDRLYFNCISIHYNGREDMGVWCEMSGQGCRAFESLSDLPEGSKWETLFEYIRHDHMHITRLDVAFDDHSGLLDINTIILDTRMKEYVSKSDYWEILESSKGQSLQFGSPSSEVLIRIYDKAAERNCDNGTHWIRCELQLRRERAAKFAELVDQGLSIGQAYCGVVVNYLRFVDPDELDSNRWRWPIKEYWGELLCHAEAIKLFPAPGIEYNLDRCKKYVIGQAGNCGYSSSGRSSTFSLPVMLTEFVKKQLVLQNMTAPSARPTVPVILAIVIVQSPTMIISGLHEDFVALLLLRRQNRPDSSSPISSWDRRSSSFG